MSMDAFISTYFAVKPLLIVLGTISLFKYTMYLILAPFYDLKEALRATRTAKVKDYYPKVSVIVPARNEEVGIADTITSILENTYKNVEIVVINDGSTDSTEEVVKRVYAYENSKTGLVYLKQENLGKAVALNHGISKSTGDIILTIDGDTILHPHAISNLVKYYKDPTIAGVVGNVYVGNATSMLGRIQAIEYRIVFFIKKIYAMTNSEFVFGGACASFRRSVFTEIGLYSTDHKTEDIDITLRLRKGGYSCTYGEDVICYTEGASTISGLFRQRTRWNYGRIVSFLHHRDLFFSRSRHHNKVLSWIVLPLDTLSLLQSAIEVVTIPLMLMYTVFTGDVIPLLFSTLVLFYFYFVAIYFDYERLTLSKVVTIPMSLLLIVVVYLEGLTILTALYKILLGKNMSWQSWAREGIKASKFNIAAK